MTRVARIGAAILALVLVAVVAVHQVNGFSARPSRAALNDTRNRLTDPSSNGRVQYWRVALKSFASEPVHGTGAGTYQLEWWRRRAVPQSVSQAHSLYLQTLGELGIPGLLFLLVGLVPVFVALRRRFRTAERKLLAALLACAAGWAIHAALDWDWQLPVVTAWLFAVGGIALANAARPLPTRPPLSTPARAAVGVLLLAAAGLPTLAAVSQSKLDDALNAYDRGDCAAATDAADSAHAALAGRAEPRMVRAWCAARNRNFGKALADLETAVERDPDDWETHYSLAVVQAAAGEDPRAQAAAALRLDPLEPALQAQTWKRRAGSARLFTDGLDYPALGG